MKNNVVRVPEPGRSPQRSLWRKVRVYLRVFRPRPTPRSEVAPNIFPSHFHVLSENQFCSPPPWTAQADFNVIREMCPGMPGGTTVNRSSESGAARSSGRHPATGEQPDAREIRHADFVPVELRRHEIHRRRGHAGAWQASLHSSQSLRSTANRQMRFAPGRANHWYRRAACDSPYSEFHSGFSHEH